MAYFCYAFGARFLFSTPELSFPLSHLLRMESMAILFILSAKISSHRDVTLPRIESTEEKSGLFRSKQRKDRVRHRVCESDANASNNSDRQVA